MISRMKALVLGNQLFDMFREESFSVETLVDVVEEAMEWEREECAKIAISYEGYTNAGYTLVAKNIRDRSKK